MAILRQDRSYREDIGRLTMIRIMALMGKGSEVAKTLPPPDVQFPSLNQNNWAALLAATNLVVASLCTCEVRVMT